ncbi:hypothetical protein Hypma_006970 [Hypsizygus marmoreus]|uniref:Uncharacterized protein n=1 Tax=Hypsizygus marmoreus TaxID=39966 RepID=A0A369JYR1_HYPMA|nr:hypothetical protein Hypma_006970 [Hypsizygus marmoreus]
MSRNLLSVVLAKAKEARHWRSRNSQEPNRNGHAGSVAVALETSQPASGSNTLETQNSDGFSTQPPPAKRVRRMPRRYRLDDIIMHDKTLIDILPQPIPMFPEATNTELPPHPSAPANVESVVCSPALFDTATNVFGVFCRYHGRTPSHDPERYQNLTTASDIPCAPSSLSESDLGEVNPGAPSSTAVTLPQKPSYYPYPNESSFLLGDWYWSRGPQKSEKDFKKLLNIISRKTFSPPDIQNTNWHQINKQLSINSWDKDSEEWEDIDAGWHKSHVTIRVPFHRNLANPGVRDYTVADFYHRSLVSIIENKLKNGQDMRHFHYEPHELLLRTDTEDIRLYGELYTSASFIAAHNEIQNAPGEPGCSLQRVVVALMFWSDATHLTNFGTAKLWPLYLFFGNESKYRRCKPSNNLCEYVAYFECLPDEFKDFAVHEQWRILLDDEFLHAYEHGLVVQCGDGITRCFYPRIFSYSADYEEKALMATIRHMGLRPCPRCKVLKADTHLVGNIKDKRDRLNHVHVDDHPLRHHVSCACDAIYNKNFGVDSAYVKRLMKPQSLLPTSNAFSDRLSQFGFNFFAMFLVDLMHEVEVGTWKATLIHLLRILASLDENLLHKLDKQFRQVPSFGRDTIRRFTSNTSELKKMAAWNYEDFLQCAIPVFEGLLPEPHNTQVMRLLFHFGHWHGLAKLRLHSEITIDLLDKEMTVLGNALRSFKVDTCSKFATRELAREAQARKRCKANDGSERSDSSEPSRKPKAFNLNTYKAHALGDYAYMIRHYGTTDSYSTELGELEHRTPKRRYQRTSKKGFKKQLAQIERRQARIKRIREKLITQEKPQSDLDDVRTPQVDADAKDPTMHHYVGISENFPLHIGTFLRSHYGDPAIMASLSPDFFPKLKQHLLSRLEIDLLGQNPVSLGNWHGLDSSLLYIKKDVMYCHKVMRINYTTYDVRRTQDTVNPNTEHRDIMLLSQDALPVTPASDSETHQYRYA